MTSLRTSFGISAFPFFFFVLFCTRLCKKTHKKRFVEFFHIDLMAKNLEGGHELMNISRTVNLI